MALNFGTTPTFGTPTTSTSTFSFGNQSTAAKPVSSMGQMSMFKSPATTSAPQFGMGSNIATTSSGFGFGTTFGAPAGAQTQPNTFGFGTTTSSAFSTFGAPTQTTSSGLFSGFGATTTTSSMFPTLGQQSTGLSFGATKPSFGSTIPSTGLNFGLGSTLGQGLGQQQQQQQQQMQQLPSEIEQISLSVSACQMFNDEHDKILAKLNLLQASWGTGKGYYSPNAPPVEYSPHNPLYRFKAVAYINKPNVDGKNGIIALQFKKKGEEIKKQEEQLKTVLNNVLGNKPNLMIHIDNIRSLNENSTLVFIYVEEKLQNLQGTTKRILNTELANFLCQNMQKQQLINCGVENVYPLDSPEKDQIKEYLSCPPPGFNADTWIKAQEENPDPEKLIPVPIYGFSDLKWRHQCQNEETNRHQLFLNKIGEDLTNLKAENENSRIKLQEFKQKLVDLDHRILKLMVQQQINRNVGVALQPEEEIIRSRLESIQTQLNSPQLSGLLGELLTHVRLHKQEASQQEQNTYNMNDAVQEEFKQFLCMQQKGIKSLIEIMNEDVEDLKTIETDLQNLVKISRV